MDWMLLLLGLFGLTRLYAKYLGYYHFMISGFTSPHDVKRDYVSKPMVTFMVPSLNEGRVVCDSIESIMASDYPKDKIEILAVDDGSVDDTWEWLQKMQAKYPENVRVWQNNPNKGKASTLIDMVQVAKGEIVFTIDSDTVVAKDAIDHIVSCYGDPDIGGVCGFVLCKNLNDSMWTKMQGMFFVNFYVTCKTYENQFKASRVLSGQIASFRRAVFLECIPEMQTRNFLGVSPIRASEDTFLTTIISMGIGIKRAWKVFACYEARAWTNNPATASGYLKQQLRWWRSANSGAMVMGSLFQNIMRAGVAPVLISTLNFIGLLTWLFSAIVLWNLGYILPVLVIVLISMCIEFTVATLFYNILIGKNDPVAGKIKNPIFTGIWSGCWGLASLMSLGVVSLFTFDDGAWVTRTNGQSNISQK